MAIAEKLGVLNGISSRDLHAVEGEAWISTIGETLADPRFIERDAELQETLSRQLQETTVLNYSGGLGRVMAKLLLSPTNRNYVMPFVTKETFHKVAPNIENVCEILGFSAKFKRVGIMGFQPHDSISDVDRKTVGVHELAHAAYYFSSMSNKKLQGTTIEQRSVREEVFTYSATSIVLDIETESGFSHLVDDAYDVCKQDPSILEDGRQIIVNSKNHREVYKTARSVHSTSYVLLLERLRSSGSIEESQMVQLMAKQGLIYSRNK